MEKIGICTMDGKPIIGRVEYEEAVLKVNEVVDWINDHGEYVILRKPPEGQIWQLVER